MYKLICFESSIRTKTNLSMLSHKENLIHRMDGKIQKFYSNEVDGQTITWTNFSESNVDLDDLREWFFGQKCKENIIRSIKIDNKCKSAPMRQIHSTIGP